jgi:hypothetical protein
MHPIGMLAIAAVLCGAGPHDHGKHHMREGRLARTTHATRPASKMQVLPIEARYARAALVTLDVAAIVKGMTSATRARVAASDAEP